MSDRDWQKQMQDATEAYNRFQKELNKNLRARQQLETQLTENTSVKEEFGYLDASAKVFKQVGPVLVPQDLEEAKGNVQKRLDWINSELKRVDAAAKDLHKNLEKQKEVLMKLQKEVADSQVNALAAKHRK
ncbi:prefoldin subunit 6-like [Paramacrobiotus metropolitanus]|uniref:prefoldin subunit 6-like n=1 Tax=Paramacrobiotus metropolitanus TaxID=2943436 RepID=UPI00244564D7|nr:prefoldin subunit 6-like [Paramacrobiotus metropolitanus]